MLRPEEVWLRQAHPTERSALEELQRRASLMWEEDRQWLLDHPEMIELPPDQIEGGHVWVAESERGVLGFAVVLPADGGNAELDGLFVEPDAWRSGIGRRLMAQCRSSAQALGAEYLYVVANSRALGFYHKVGFEALGETPTQFRPGIRMRLFLGGDGDGAPSVG
jgi:GNAT superfamily N-acetyltransferase